MSPHLSILRGRPSWSLDGLILAAVAAIPAFVIAIATIAVPHYVRGGDVEGHLQVMTGAEPAPVDRRIAGSIAAALSLASQPSSRGELLAAMRRVRPGGAAEPASWPSIRPTAGGPDQLGASVP